MASQREREALRLWRYCLRWPGNVLIVVEGKNQSKSYLTPSLICS